MSLPSIPHLVDALAAFATANPLLLFVPCIAAVLALPPRPYGVAVSLSQSGFFAAVWLWRRSREE
ncbi:uncharacterized protein K452DRAFT_285567 [Aplosporella prunicola CBS 121167]|uniref:Uncharacterized protein n=1 Tax=Aplosporella prunicola CBS 121167 TaxID=1176127 RepID=A0A6A6BLP2_9PEZI|nr:uncharacterized protein K452DRAFT_285567 [Aplosporella prunicola CBS 121167]KAF2144323.1 hypothetical protein K452DRAFT_285567 [Aplosporella prunicola CBS 121167]